MYLGSSFQEKQVKQTEKVGSWGFLVAQWVRTHLPAPGTQARSLVQKIPRAMDNCSQCTTTTESEL